ncbi:ABC transporter [Streptomyces zinciresistens K42]|uniref:ABC transporter n=1 Tax=Streptomyces zinciresistens K42 TaxID=700597 RepID=G2GB85_9ACTN|nr:ABC transporter ATP-binding protein [Streptomyces zinciresistens]EGX59262.1 ABC transporter [Streptomyces zinciresistens K42]
MASSTAAPRPEPATGTRPHPPATATAPLAAGAAALRLVRGSLSASRGPALRLAWWTMLSAAPALVSGKALALAVDDGFLARSPRTAALYLVLFALCALAGAWAGRQTYPWLAEIVEPLRDRLLGDVVRGTLRRAVAPGARRDGVDAVAVAQLTRQVEVVRDALAGQLMLVWQFVLTVGAVVVGTAVIAPAAVPLVAVPLVLALGVFAVLASVTVRWQHAAFQAEETLAQRAVETVGALRDIVATGTRDHAEGEVLQAVRAHLLASRKLATVAAVRRLVVGLGAHSPLLLVVLTAPALLERGMTPGDVVGVLGYVLTTLEPAVRLMVQGVGASWLRLSVAAQRLAGAARDPGTPPPPAHPLTPDDGSVVVSGVTFAYGPDADPVVDGLELSLAHGEQLAVVGPSGVGKSTTADLLAGMLVPDAGRITLGGVPLDRIARDDLCRARALLPQNPYVFAGTLRENLCQLAPGAPDESVAHTVGELGMDDLVRRLGGLDGRVDPAALSSGERQLVALARVHLSRAALVILDEATRHLDAEAEERIEEAFRRRPGTVVALAHRISLARRADKVLLLDGERAWTGTHDTLLAQVPLYADLVGLWNTGTAGPG